jgi:hypothetical protein
MNSQRSKIHILRKNSDLRSQAVTGVSLHCHTEHSKEMLDFVPHYAAKLPIIAQFWKRERQRYIEREGRDLDFSTAFWSPPLDPRSVFDIETEQINSLGLNPLVSLTDHDSIAANLEVNGHPDAPGAPISMEWTVPFRYGFFHVGVHNLPPNNADDLAKALLDYTFNTENQNDAKLTEAFALLNELPGVLVILNHPLWDIEMVGKERHLALLNDFLATHRKWIHALEINGFRTWSENKAVMDLAGSLGIPLATGGDRHGCQPNTVINLTKAETFEEFVDEVRRQKRTEVVMMPAYRHPLHSRQLQSFAEILREYPEFRDGRKKWFDRVHFDVGDGFGPRQLSVHWVYGGPTWLRWAIWTLGILGSPAMRPVFALARKKADRVPRSVMPTRIDDGGRDEISRGLTSDPVG